MEKSNKRTLEISPGKSSKLKQSNMRNLELNNEKDGSVQDKMLRSQWKEFDNSNKVWKIFEVPKLNKIGQLYLDKFSKNPDAIIKEE